jgi:protease stability complex PrcB-like protein
MTWTWRLAASGRRLVTVLPRCSFLLLTLALAACSSPSSPDGQAPLAVTRLGPETASFTYYSGMRQSQRLVVRDQATWQQTWSTIWSNTSAVPALPAVDFDREMVIVAALGERTSGGFSILVDRVTESGNGLTVSVRSVSPGSSCIVTLALTQPVDIVRVTRRDGMVSFTETTAVQNCN